MSIILPDNIPSWYRHTRWIATSDRIGWITGYNSMATRRPVYFRLPSQFLTGSGSRIHISSMAWSHISTWWRHQISYWGFTKMAQYCTLWGKTLTTRTMYVILPICATKYTNHTLFHVLTWLMNRYSTHTTHYSMCAEERVHYGGNTKTTPYSMCKIIRILLYGGNMPCACLALFSLNSVHKRDLKQHHFIYMEAVHKPHLTPCVK